MLEKTPGQNGMVRDLKKEQDRNMTHTNTTEVININNKICCALSVALSSHYLIV